MTSTRSGAPVVVDAVDVSMSLSVTAADLPEDADEIVARDVIAAFCPSIPILDSARIVHVTLSSSSSSSSSHVNASFWILPPTSPGDTPIAAVVSALARQAPDPNSALNTRLRAGALTSSASAMQFTVITVAKCSPTSSYQAGSCRSTTRRLAPLESGAAADVPTITRTVIVIVVVGGLVILVVGVMYHFRWVPSPLRRLLRYRSRAHEDHIEAAWDIKHQVQGPMPQLQIAEQPAAAIGTEYQFNAAYPGFTMSSGNFDSYLPRSLNTANNLTLGSGSRTPVNFGSAAYLPTRPNANRRSVNVERDTTTFALAELDDETRDL